MFTVAYENDDNVYSDGSNMSETGNNSEDEEINPETQGEWKNKKKKKQDWNKRKIN